MIVYRGHMIGPSDEKDPATGRVLYGISELKTALTPPLLFTQKECIEYIMKVEPFDKHMRIDAYGRRYGTQHKKEKDRHKNPKPYWEKLYGSYET